jgi:hypothetical protein
VLPGQQPHRHPVTPPVRAHAAEAGGVALDRPVFDPGEVVGGRVGMPVGVTEAGHREALLPPERVEDRAPPRPEEAPIERGPVPPPPRHAGDERQGDEHHGGHGAELPPGQGDERGGDGGAGVAERPPGAESGGEGGGADDHERGRDRVVVEGAGPRVGHADHLHPREWARTGADGLDAWTAPVHTRVCVLVERAAVQAAPWKSKLRCARRSTMERQ